jgi:Fe-S cluster assembly protein SufD
MISELQMPPELDMDRKADESVLIEDFDRKIGLIAPDSDSGWAATRRQAIKAFADSGFPGKKSEAYKYTPVTKWVKSHLMGTADRVIHSASTAFGHLDGLHVQTTDGQMLGGLKGALPEGLTLCTLQEANAQKSSALAKYLSAAVVLERDPFSALASAFAEDGILIHVSEKTVIDQPIVLHHDSLTENGLAQPRILVVVEAGAKVQIVEHFPDVDAGSSFENRLVEVFVAEQAVMDHVVVIERNSQALFVNALFVHQAEKSMFKTNTITLGGGLVRNNLNFLPDAEECETHLHGLYIAKGKAHVDNHTLVDHAKPNCFSNEMFKGIVTDEATGVFNGKVLVRQDAQKTNAYQSSKSIVLDRSAQIYAKPELEIYADDVKCSHGATTGELDEDAMFYLRSRGIKPEAARLMLLEAFARDVVDLVEIETVRDYLNIRLHQLLSAGV